MIEIAFNGQKFIVEKDISLADFLKNKLPEGKFAIDVDMEVVPRSSYEVFILKNGMKIEAITFVGGG
jgi:thiamine biosynthesis protein ThiS